ncbi:MAG: M14 family metallopeptidase [Proteobacteria bacterium]|nr:M14 family metallopeptidase [Pseudomonadota bacterium]
MRRASKTLTTPLVIVAATLAAALAARSANAKDAFGLDGYKHDAATVTETKTPYNTRFGNPITIYTVPAKLQSKANPPVRFLMQGGLHGNEMLASEFVAWAAQRFAAGNSTLNRLNGGNVEIDFIPYANPDGTVLFARYNGNHINLNRNFGVLWGLTKENPGKAAFSEVESRAIRDLLEKRSYSGAVDVHGYVNWIVLPTAPSDSLKGLPIHDSKKVKKYQKWSNAMHHEVKRHLPGYAIKTAGGLGDGGAFEDYAWWGAGVPAFCLEAFTDQRFVAGSVATLIVDLLTPKFLASSGPSNGRNDMFFVYENFIRTMFDEALKLNDDSTEFAAKN